MSALFLIYRKNNFLKFSINFSLDDVRAASDELSQVLDKYVAVIVLGQPANSKLITNNGPSLLDLSTPLEDLSANSQSDQNHQLTKNDSKTDMEVLGDIFNSLSNPSESLSSTASSLMLPDAPIMQPIGVPLVSRKCKPFSSLFFSRITNFSRSLLIIQCKPFCVN